MGQVTIDDYALLTAKDLCRLWNIDRKTLARWIERGLLKAHRPSKELGRVRISGREVKRFIQGESDG